MSKAVSGVGNAIGGVLKGAVKLVKDVGNGIGRIVKDIGSSKLGRAVLIAGAIYFGGAALSGGFGASAGGGSFFSGMGAGVSSAATSLSSAWTSTLAGNFAEAGSTIGSSWGTASNAGYMGSPGYLATSTTAPVSLTQTAAAPEVASAESTAVNSGNTAAGTGTPLNSATDQVSRMRLDQVSNMDPVSKYSLNGPGVSDPGLNLSNSGTGFNAGGSSIPYNPPSPGVMSSIWNSPYTAPALISGGMQVGGAYIQGQAQEKQLREQREYEAQQLIDARNRYNSNVGTALWDPNAQAPIYQNQGPAWDPYAEARSRAAQVYAPAQTGVAARYMNPTSA
jgi:hypothetical protein